MHHGFPGRIEFAQPFGKVIERDQVTANVSGPVFIWFANIEHKNILMRFQSLFEIFCVHVREIGQGFTPAAIGRLLT